MTKTKFVQDLKIGEEVKDIFFVTGRYYGKKHVEYLFFDLQDKTGRIRGKAFENIEKYIGIKERVFAQVVGTVAEYQGRKEILIKEIKEIAPALVRKEDFVLMSRYDPEEMLAQVQGFCAQVSNPFLVRLLNSFLSDLTFRERFKRSPAAAKAHQAYLGGLLEHTVYLGKLVQAAKGVYPDQFDYSLLLTGAILHDVGKIEEYEYDINIDFSTKGRLIGHIVLGYTMVKEKIEKIEGFPSDLANKVLHLILASHGELEHGSPVGPKIPEAVFLYHLDNLDAKMAMVRELKEKGVEGDLWSEYHKLLETQIYFG